jgi:uncharacterized lipoprotein YmbA
MKIITASVDSDAPVQAQPRSEWRDRSSRAGRALLWLGLCGALTGCFGILKPARSTTRYFVLTALPNPAGAVPARGGLALGLGQVKVAPYLFNSSLAVRRSTNEIIYIPSAIWAERLDAGFQRVLAADLAILLPTDQVLVSAWQKEDVAAELYVAVEQFEVDTAGEGRLVARWRIMAPGGDKLLQAGRTRLAHAGPAPEPDASGSIATLSDLVAELSRQLAGVLRKNTPITP